MNKIDIGFPCERCIAIPQPFLDLMHDNPLTGDLYIHSLGHIANAVFHRVSHSQASKQHIFLYCTAGKGNIILGNKKLVLTANQCIILPAGVPHEYASDQSDPWTLYWIAFMGAKGVIFANAMGEPNDVPPSIY